MDQAMVKWQLKVNLVQTRIIWEEGLSEGLSMLGYPVGMTVRDYLKFAGVERQPTVGTIIP